MTTLTATIDRPQAACEDPDTDTSYIAPIAGPKDNDDPTDKDNDSPTIGAAKDENFRGSGRIDHLLRCFSLPSECTCNPNYGVKNPSCPVCN
jgi:hypothetical protein